MQKQFILFLFILLHTLETKTMQNQPILPSYLSLKNIIAYLSTNKASHSVILNILNGAKEKKNVNYMHFIDKIEKEIRTLYKTQDIDKIDLFKPINSSTITPSANFVEELFSWTKQKINMVMKNNFSLEQYQQYLNYIAKLRTDKLPSEIQQLIWKYIEIPHKEALIRAHYLLTFKAPILPTIPLIFNTHDIYDINERYIAYNLNNTINIICLDTLKTMRIEQKPSALTLYKNELITFFPNEQILRIDLRFNTCTFQLNLRPHTSITKCKNLLDRVQQSIQAYHDKNIKMSLEQEYLMFKNITANDHFIAYWESYFTRPSSWKTNITLIDTRTKQKKDSFFKHTRYLPALSETYKSIAHIFQTNNELQIKQAIYNTNQHKVIIDTIYYSLEQNKIEFQKIHYNTLFSHLDIANCQKKEEEIVNNPHDYPLIEHIKKHPYKNLVVENILFHAQILPKPQLLAYSLDNLGKICINTHIPFNQFIMLKKKVVLFEDNGQQIKLVGILPRKPALKEYNKLSLKKLLSIIPKYQALFLTPDAEHFVFD